MLTCWPAGIGLTCFAAVLGQIFYFRRALSAITFSPSKCSLTPFFRRPSGVTVSGLFILVIAHVLGQLWHMLLPKASRGRVWAFLNPCPFNIKEHVA